MAQDDHARSMRRHSDTDVTLRRSSRRSPIVDLTTDGTAPNENSIDNEEKWFMEAVDTVITASLHKFFASFWKEHRDLYARVEDIWEMLSRQHVPPNSPTSPSTIGKGSNTNKLMPKNSARAHKRSNLAERRSWPRKARHSMPNLMVPVESSLKSLASESDSEASLTFVKDSPRSAGNPPQIIAFKTESKSTSNKHSSCGKQQVPGMCLSQDEEGTSDSSSSSDSSESGGFSEVSQLCEMKREGKPYNFKNRRPSDISSGGRSYASKSSRQQTLQNLDTMHTDKLLEDCGLTRRPSMMSQKSEAKSEQKSEHSCENKSNKSTSENKSEASKGSDTLPAAPSDDAKAVLSLNDNINFLVVPSENEKGDSDNDDTVDFLGAVPIAQFEIRKDKVDISPRLQDGSHTWDGSVIVSPSSNYRLSERGVLRPSQQQLDHLLSITSRRSSLRTSSGFYSHSGMDALRAEHESMLVATASASSVERVSLQEDDEELEDVSKQNSTGTPIRHSPPFLLLLYGITPFREGIFGWSYSFLILVTLVLLFVHSVIFSAYSTDDLYLHLSAVCYSGGSIVCFLSLRLQRIEYILGPHNDPLDSYARKFGFLDDWRKLSMWRFLTVAALWMCMILSRGTLLTLSDCPKAMGGHHDEEGALTMVAFIFVSGSMVALSFSQLHVCCGLEMFVDKFCYRTFNDMDVSKSITEWNILQAILRRAAATLDACFLAFGTSVMATLLLTGVQLLQGSKSSFNATDLDVHCSALWCGWVLPPVILVLLTVFRAASVTEKCSRVPALVNSWTFQDGRQIDHERQYVVQYIMHSAAGFYVKGVRLSTFMALKLTYLLGVVAFAVVTQLILRA